MTSVKQKSGFPARSCTWWFSLAVRIKTGCSAFVSPANFTDILYSSYCQAIQINKLRAAKETSIVSFSIDTNAASVLRLQNAPFAQIYGLISTSGTQMYETAVRKWLHHEDIVNLELTAIRRCDSSGQFHEKIEKFLKESTTTQSRLTGDGNRQGLRLRVDLCMDSAAPPDRGGRRCSSTVARLATASAECDSARTAPMPTPPPARAATSPLASAAPLRVSFRTRIQIFASAPDAQMNRAATDGAMELLDSLDSRKTRLCLVRGRFACGDVSPAASETEELIYAVIAPTREDCFSHGEAPRERSAMQAALLRILKSACAGHESRVSCLVDLDVHEEFGATPRSLALKWPNWVVRIDRRGDDPCESGCESCDPHTALAAGALPRPEHGRRDWPGDGGREAAGGPATAAHGVLPPPPAAADPAVGGANAELPPPAMPAAPSSPPPAAAAAYPGPPNPSSSPSAAGGGGAAAENVTATTGCGGGAAANSGSAEKIRIRQCESREPPTLAAGEGVRGGPCPPSPSTPSDVSTTPARGPRPSWLYGQSPGSPGCNRGCYSDSFQGYSGFQGYSTDPYSTDPYSYGHAAPDFYGQRPGFYSGGRSNISQGYSGYPDETFESGFNLSARVAGTMESLQFDHGLGVQGMKRRLGVQGMKRRSEPLESERLYSAQISWLSSQAEQQARRADNAELRFMKSRQERAEAIKARDLALLRERTLRGRLDEVKSDFFSTQQSVIRLEKERDQRVVTDAQGNTYRLFEIQIAQPKPGEVNVDGRGKGKRVAVPFVVSQWAGSLKCREGNIGGTEYTPQEMVLSMQTDLEEGIGAKHNRGQRETDNLMRRARADGNKVEAAFHPRKGCKTRQKPPEGDINAFPRPSEACMRLKIRSTFRLLMHMAFSKMLEEAVSINVVSDGKQFGPHHTLGAVVCLTIRDNLAETVDFFGNSIPVYTTVRMPMCLQQAPNKIAVDVQGSNDETYVQQTPFLCLRSLVLSFSHEIFVHYGFKLALQLDAAADNRGCGNLERSMDALSNPNSVHDCIMVTRTAWQAVETDLETDGMLNLLQQLKAEVDLPQLTENLKKVRLAKRYLQELTKETKKLQKKLRELEDAETVAATPSPSGSAASAPPLPASQAATACSNADQQEGGSDSVSKAESGPGMDRSAQSAASLRRNYEETMHDVERAKQDVAEAKARLAADCAASLAAHKIETGLGMEARTRPIELNVSGPVMRRPEDVRRIYALYEEMLTPFMKSIKLARWVGMRWYCWAQGRAAARAAAAAAAAVAAPAHPAPTHVSARQGAEEPMQGLQKLSGSQRTDELLRRFRVIRKLRWERRGLALYGHVRPGQVRQDWKCCHLVFNAEGQAVAFNRETLKSMFERKRGQLDGADAVVSMQQNPARFWPCRDQRVSVSSADPAAQSQSQAGAAAVADPPPTKLCHTGHVQQCCYHSSHNSVDDFCKILDGEIFPRVVSTAIVVKNPFNEPGIKEAIKRLLSDDPKVRADIDSRTGYFKSVRAGIEQQAALGNGISLKEAMGEIGYADFDLDENFLVESAATCAIVRWATVAKSAAWLAVWCRVIAFGMLYIGGVGLTEQCEVNAAIAIFSHKGFISALHQGVRLDKKLSEAFEFLVRSTTIAQLAIVRYVYILVIQPLMQCMSENNECSERMVGMESVPRRLLLVLARSVFVSTGVWSRKCRLGHRSHGAEFQVPDGAWRQGCVRLLCGPLCTGKIRRTLGNDWGDWGVFNLDKMVNATTELLKTFRVLAAKGDKLMPQNAEEIFTIAYAGKKLYGVTDEKTRDSSFALRMLQLQILAAEVLQNVTAKLVITLRHDLFGAKSFVAGMCKSRETFGEVRRLLPGGQQATSKLVYAHPMAGANAVITLLMGQEVKSHFAKQLGDHERALDFFPAFAGVLWSNGGLEEIRSFLGISEWHKREKDMWGQHHNHLKDLQCVDAQGIEQSGVRIQVEVDLPPPLIADEEQQHWNWVSKSPMPKRGQVELPARPPPGAHEKRSNWTDALPKPLSEFRWISKWAEIAAKLSESGKPIEGSWAWPALAFEGRPSMGAVGLVGYHAMNGHRGRGLDPQSLALCPGLDPGPLAKQGIRFNAASEMAQFHGWSRVLNVDKVLHLVMGKDYKSRDAAPAARKGGWTATNHGGAYRRDIYAHPKGKRLTATKNSQAKLIQGICQRMAGIDAQGSSAAGVAKRSYRRSADSKPRPRKACQSNVGRAAPASGSADSARPTLKDMVICATRSARAGRNQRAKRQRTGHGGDEEDWTPESHHADLAAEPVDREGRCTRQSARRKDTSAGSLTVLTRVSAAAAPDPGQHPRCGAVSESSDASDCNQFTSVSTATGSEPAAAPEYAFAAAPSNPTRVMDKQGKDCGQLSGTPVLSGPSDCRAAGARVGEGTAAEAALTAATEHVAGPISESHDCSSEDDEDQPLVKRRKLDPTSDPLSKDSASRPAGPAGPNPHVPLACVHAARSKGGRARGSGQGRKGSRKNGKNSCRSGRMAGSKACAADSCGADEDSDDDVPLIHETTLNKEQSEVELNQNPWSMDFAIACSDIAWYGKPEDLSGPPIPVWRMKELNTAVYGKEDQSTVVTITRQESPYLVHLLKLRGCAVHPGITFVVRARSDVNYYLMFDDCAGACVVTVDKIMPPDDATRNESERWKETMSYKRAFRTDEAVMYSKAGKARGLHMGNDYFRKLLAEEAKMDPDEYGRPYTTYHVGDAYYTGDIRKLVGVVRWISKDMKAVADDYFPEYLQADLVITGAGVVQRLQAQR